MYYLSNSPRLKKNYRVYHVMQHCAGSLDFLNDPVIARMYLELISERLREHGIVLWNYVFMPAHYHLLLYVSVSIQTDKDPWVLIADVLRSVNTSFAKFNKKLALDGRLFSSRPRYVAIENRKQLLEAMYYIFSNPKGKFAWNWKEHWLSAANEYTKRSQEHAGKQDLEVHMEMTLKQMLIHTELEKKDWQQILEQTCGNDDGEEQRRRFIVDRKNREKTQNRHGWEMVRDVHK